MVKYSERREKSISSLLEYALPSRILYWASAKYNKNLRKNGRMRAKCDKWLVHIPFLCYLTILLISAEGAVYGGY